MAAAVEPRDDFSAGEPRQLAAGSKDANQVRRLLALAAVRDGKTRAEAGRIGGMDRRTLRDWVRAFNGRGLEGLINAKAPGPKSKLTSEQKRTVADIVEAGPDPEKDGVMRWRCVDLKRVIKERFDIDPGEVSIARLLKKLGFSHVSARPRHQKQDGAAIETFKKTSPPAWPTR
ncbi:MAG: winged helix-turn-helix domain-containing protein [Methylocella sp.]